MEILVYRGRKIELTILGDIDHDELVLEVVDLSADGGFWFSLARNHDGVLAIRQYMERPIPLDLLEQVARIAGVELTEL
jgi:hypothetical protein